MSPLQETFETLSNRGNARGADAVFNAASNAARPVADTRSSVSSWRGATSFDVRPAPPADRWRSSRRFVGIAASLLIVATAVVTVALASRTGRSTPVSIVSDPAPGEWSRFPTPILSPRFEYASAVTNDGWFVWGGFTEDSEHLRDGAYYHRETGTWQALPDPPSSFESGFAVAAWSGTEVILVETNDGPHVAAFNPASFTWRELPSPDGFAATPTMNAQLYTVGNVIALVTETGGNDGPTQLGRVDLFDPRMAAWTSASLPNGTVDGAYRFTASPSSLFAVRQPTTVDSCDDSMDVFSYDPATNVWSQISMGAAPFTGWSPEIVAWAGDQLVAAGGYGCTAGVAPVRNSARFNVGTGKWSVGVALPADVTVARLYDSAIWTGQELIALNNDGTPWVYQPAADLWQVGASFLPAGEKFSNTPAAWLDGRLVVWSAGIRQEFPESSGNLCCFPRDEAWTYQPVQTTPAG